MPRLDFPCMSLRLQTQTVLPRMLLPCKTKTKTSPKKTIHGKRQKSIVRNTNNASESESHPIVQDELELSTYITQALIKKRVVYLLEKFIFLKIKNKIFKCKLRQIF